VGQGDFVSSLFRGQWAEPGAVRGLFGVEGAGVGVGMFVVVWRMVGLFDETASWSFIILPISSLASRIARSFAWVIFAGSLVI
jgi:hypothetical protein